MTQEQFVELPLDMAYSNYIFNNDAAFLDLIGLIEQMYVFNKDVYILVHHDNPYREELTEALIKIIQERYGYNCYIANEPDDINYISGNDSFSPYMINILDSDLERYKQILIQQGVLSYDKE